MLPLNVDANNCMVAVPCFEFLRRGIEPPSVPFNLVLASLCFEMPSSAQCQALYIPARSLALAVIPISKLWPVCLNVHVQAPETWIVCLGCKLSTWTLHDVYCFCAFVCCLSMALGRSVFAKAF